MSTIWVILSIAALMLIDGFVMTRNKVSPRIKLWYVLSVMLVLLIGVALSK